jgi:hypothetical protein
VTARADGAPSKCGTFADAADFGGRPAHFLKFIPPSHFSLCFPRTVSLDLSFMKRLAGRTTTLLELLELR